MKYLKASQGKTAVGLAYGPSTVEFIDKNPGWLDYVEVPFEQLRHTPHVAAIQETIPVVLHCASMSVAGFVPPSEETLDAIKREAERTRTPWIGEHLAFVSADGLSEAGMEGPTSLTYTVCPQLSEETIERVAENLDALRQRFEAPLILENAPQYFDVPGSTMPSTDFVCAVAARCDVGLLLDLTHFLITALNTGADAAEELERLPLGRVVEVHISGLNFQSDVAWDDHATPAPPAVFDLLGRVLERARPRAVTLEYNWSPAFPQAILKSHLERVRAAVGRA